MQQWRLINNSSQLNMFREIILPIFRSTRPWVTACGIMHPRCCRPVAGRQHYGCIIPQAVIHSLLFLMTGKIIARNMLSWLELLISRYCCIYLVVYIIYISLYFLRLAHQSQFIPLQNVVYFITLTFLVRKILTFYVNDLLLFKYLFPGPRG